MCVSPAVLSLWERTLNLPRLRAPDELRDLISHLPDDAKVVELGSFAGESAQQFLTSGKITTLWCVDTWKGDYDQTDLASGSDIHAAEIAFDVRVGHDLRVIKLKRSTVAAVELFPPVYLDMVYIDADHSYESVKQDIELWRPKLKPGGILSGHDYSLTDHPGVKQAVDELYPSGIVVLPDSSWMIRI